MPDSSAFPGHSPGRGQVRSRVRVPMPQVTEQGLQSFHCDQVNWDGAFSQRIPVKPNLHSHLEERKNNKTLVMA